MTAAPRPTEPARRPPWFGPVTLAGAAGGGAGRAAPDRVAPSGRRVGVTVPGEEHHPPGRACTALVAEGRPCAVLRAAGERWWLAGSGPAPPAATTASAAIETGVCARLRDGRYVAVASRRGRPSGTVEVLAVEP